MYEKGQLVALRRTIIRCAVSLVRGEEHAREPLIAAAVAYRDELSTAYPRRDLAPTLFPVNVKEWEDTAAHYAILHSQDHEDDGDTFRRVIIGYLTAKERVGRGDAADHLEQVLAHGSHIGPRNVDEPDIDPLSYAGPFD